MVELGDSIDEHQLGQLRDRLGQALEGKPLSAASVAVSDLAVQLNGQGGLPDAIGRAATVLVETLVDHAEERLLLGGTANLTRNTADFGGSLRSVLEALEEQVVVLKLLAAQQEAGKVTVRIGHETEAEQMARYVGGEHRLRQHRARSTAGWAWWDPPEWTIREPSPTSPQLLYTSAKSWAPASGCGYGPQQRLEEALEGLRRGTRLLRPARGEQGRE